MCVEAAAARCKSSAKARSDLGRTGVRPQSVRPSLKTYVGTLVRTAAGPTDIDTRLGLGERRLWLAAKFHCLRF